MRYGLLIKDRQGRHIVDQNTFTVRLVTVVPVGAGSWASVLRLPVPLARAGMFATACPNGQFVYGPNGEVIHRNSRWETSRQEMIGTRMPALQVGDGYVELFPPMMGVGAAFDGNLLVYVFTYI